MAEKELPRLARTKDKGKITTYPDREVEELYYVGKGNGWDTPRIVRDAVTKALQELADQLRKPST
jgi:hypothetical protein